jgi:peptidoglycan/xylan/chitin deacetylase (PgdA/CDA1 family)
MRGHLYCSTRCARDAGRAAVRAHLKARLYRPIPSRLAVLGVLLACSAPGVLALRTVRELDRLNTPAPFTPVRRGPTARIERVEQGPEGTRIDGTAPAGAAVFLFAGGQFAGTAIASDGAFRFEGVRSPGPYLVGTLPLAAPAAPAAPEPATAAAAADSTGSPTDSTASTDSTAAHVVPPAPRAAPAASAAGSHANDAARPFDGVRVPDLSRGPRDRREVLLSFDAGSSDRGAREILAALREKGIRTTIFLTGDFIRRNPDLTRRIAGDGHEVGNHTDSHPHLTTYARDGRQATRPGVDRWFLVAELGRTARAYEETTGRKMAPLWRAPFGEHNEEIRRWAAEAGYWHVGWTGGRAGLDGLDWVSDPRSKAYRTSDRVVESLVERAENGGIILLHLGSDRDDPVAPRIPKLIEGLSSRGFHFARASEFLDREGMTDERLAALRSRMAPAAPR